MINEFYAMAKVLKAQGISVQSWHHRWVPVSRKKLSLRVRISLGGNISSLLVQESVEEIRQYAPKGQKTSFPTFIIPPLFQVSGKNAPHLKRVRTLVKEKKISSSELKKELSKLMDGAQTIWNSEQISRSCSELPELLLSAIGEIPKEYRTIRRLAEAAPNMDLEKLRRRLQDWCLDQLCQQGSPVYALDLLLCENASAVNVVKSRILLDVQTKSSDIGVYSLSMIKFINDRLKQLENSESASGPLDAFGDATVGDESKTPMPFVRSRIGDIRLRNSISHPFRSRYGLSQSESYSLSHKNRAFVKDALDWILSPDKEDKVWVFCPADKSIVVFQSPVNIVRVLKRRRGMGKSSPFTDEHSSLVKSVSEILRTKKSHRRFADQRAIVRDREQVYIFVLQRVGKQSTKMRMANTGYSISDILEKSYHWHEGLSNIPELSWSSAKFPVVPDVYPLQITDLSQRLWKYGPKGLEQVSLSSPFGTHQCLQMFLDPDMGQSHFDRLVPTMLDQSFKLLTKVPKDTKPIKYAFYADRSAWMALMGMVLHRKQIRKDDYMKATPFQLGRMLCLFNDLHAAYLKTMHGEKHKTPILIGNTALANLQHSPEQALSFLFERSKPYVAWIESVYRLHPEAFSKDKWTPSRSGRWAWFEIGKIISSIIKDENLDVPEKFSDLEMIQIFLGFAAKNVRKKPSKSDESSNEDASVDRKITEIVECQS